VVLEDTTEHLRAQKAAAWREVARRIAHEIKNPLTPIALSAQRIARQVERVAAGGGPLPEEVVRILKECAATVTQEVDSVRLLVNEFSSFARFPAAEPELADLNDVVRNALAVFQGRLDGIELHSDLAPSLPRLMLDREQFKRVIVNLVDNSAEAMADSPVKRLFVATRQVAPDAVEMEVADTGCGVSMEDRERLFLPYFSTKGRGTGLGLAIVSQIVADHGAQIRVEDNSPAGARFLVELAVPRDAGRSAPPAAEPAESAGKVARE
jgi:nitrogen fixation/metabolism regulation signal transduction histidine kinase